MSATLVSSNTTIKVNGGGSGGIAGAFGTFTVTAAANEYIIMSYISNTTSSSITIGGFNYNITPANQMYTVYISPSTSITLTSVAGSNVNYNFTRFINTP